MAVIKSGAGSTLWTVDSATNAGRVTLYDASGNAFESVLDSGNHYLGAAVRQDVHSSALNSSQAAISNGVTWSGSSESTLGVAGIQVNTYADQPLTVTVYQSSDGSHWYVSDTHYCPSNYGISRTVQATGAFWYLAVTNTGSAPTNTVDIFSALCPVVEALPRSLTSGGNLKVTPTAEWQNNRVTLGLYACTTFRTIGVAAGTQNLFALTNPALPTSKNNVVIRELTITSDSTVALTSVAQQAILSKPASLPSGGTALTPVKYRSSYPSAVAAPLGGTASDGGGATAITATPGTSIWQQFLDRPHTLSGWALHPNYDMTPDVGADLRQLILIPGESILVQIVGSVLTTTHMIVNCSWLEYAAY